MHALIDWVVIGAAVIIVCAVLSRFAQSPIPLPGQKTSFNHLFHFSGRIPSVRNSEKKAEKFDALTKRITSETQYLDAARMHHRARAAYRFTKKGNHHGKNK